MSDWLTPTEWMQAGAAVGALCLVVVWLVFRGWRFDCGREGCKIRGNRYHYHESQR